MMNLYATVLCKTNNALHAVQQRNEKINAKSSCLFFSILLATLFLSPTYAQASTLSLENLERERAALINDMLDPTIDVSERLEKIKKRQRHLTDMERMVMRDERLLKVDSSLVKNAFAQYDKTFLVHAGAEENRNAAQQWFANINLTNEAVLNTRLAFRK